MKLSTRHQSFFIPTIAFSLLNEGNELPAPLRLSWSLNRVSPRIEAALELTVDNARSWLKRKIEKGKLKNRNGRDRERKDAEDQRFGRFSVD